MGATSTIRRLCDRPGAEVNLNVENFGRFCADAPYGLKSDPVFYGQLVRNYLLWTADLLIAMELAAAARPACQPAVTHLVTKAAAYFQDSARWPKIPQMSVPLSLLMPAYYTARGVQQVNSLFPIMLVDVDPRDAYNFVIHVIGQKAADQVSHHKNEDLKPLERVTTEVVGAPPVKYKSLLNNTMRIRLKEARERRPPPPAPPAPSTPPAPSVAVEAEKLLALSWSLDLSDTRIVLEQSNTPSNSYGGGSSYSSREKFLDLMRGHRFVLRVQSFSRVSYAGMTVGGPSSSQSTGDWNIQVKGGQAYLVLEGDEGGSDLHRIEKRGRGVLSFGGSDCAWQRL